MNSEDEYLDSSQIKPYVAVGPAPNLSLSIDKRTFDRWFIFATLFLVAVWLVVVGLLIWMTFDQTELKPPANPVPLAPSASAVLHSNFGGTFSAAAAIPGLVEVHPQSSNNCEAPFYGPNCSREKHHKNYFAIGEVKSNDLQVDISRTFLSDGKSFKAGSCSSTCDGTTGCVGFLYSGSTCSLLKGTVTLPRADLVYGRDLEPNFYLKSTENLAFSDTVFLGKYNFAFPPRYWLVNNTPYFAQLPLNKVERLSFAPKRAMVPPGKTGLYRRHPFLAKDIQLLLSLGDHAESYIHQPNTTLTLPPDWGNELPIYAVYF